MNSIRTPKQGTNATSRRIAEAVDDEEWQKFRVSLKGNSTENKLRKLLDYYTDNMSNQGAVGVPTIEDIRIRVDNYLKALARGGQIAPTIDYLTDMVNGKLVIRK